MNTCPNLEEGIVGGKTHASRNANKEKSSLQNIQPNRVSLDVEEDPRSVADEGNNMVMSAIWYVETDEMNSDDIEK